MFEKFMKRLDPKDMQTKGEPDQYHMTANLWRRTDYNYGFILLCLIAAPVHLSQADLRTTRKKGKSRGGTSGERYYQ